MEVREATSADTDRIRSVHLASVTELAARDYSPAQIEAWTEPIETATYDAIEAGDASVVVAEAADVVGFGSVSLASREGYAEPVDGEITGVYVHPDAVREGVGSRLLAALESRARTDGSHRVGLVASTNAVPFYEYHGYEQVRERTHRFGAEVEGPAVEMRKHLD